MTEELKSMRVGREGPVAEVTLLGPAKGNAMGPDLFRELPLVFGALDKDPEVRVAVLRGSGEHFCYGLDLPGMFQVLAPLVGGPVGALERTRLLDMLAELQASVDAIARCRKPVIAAIHGWCIGGGLDMASACDIRLCAKDARFSLREVKMAIVADLGSLQHLPRIIGEGHLRELAYTGRNIDAAEALRIGLVNSACDTPDTLFAAARALAAEIAANPPLAVQGIKRMLEWGDAKNVPEGLRQVLLWNTAFLPSKDLQEAFAAFAEKRPPEFKGE
ncbi:MAG: crotonase/enoyl-CoA hydratase family protein [Deltaproteobacteria bacterium]|nr:crotonase/enoyl-CoA hydratase family protein [Deltaproteobacteria bacterium]